MTQQSGDEAELSIVSRVTRERSGGYSRGYSRAGVRDPCATSLTWNVPQTQTGCAQSLPFRSSFVGDQRSKRSVRIGPSVIGLVLGGVMPTSSPRRGPYRADRSPVLGGRRSSMVRLALTKDGFSK